MGGVHPYALEMDPLCVFRGEVCHSVMRVLVDDKLLVEGIM